MALITLKSTLYVVFAEILFGVNIVILKALSGFFPIYTLLTIRYSLGMIATSVPVFLGIKHDKKPQLNKHLILPFALQFIMGGFFYNMLLIKGISYSSASHAGILGSLLPILVAMLSSNFYEKNYALRSGMQSYWQH